MRTVLMIAFLFPPTASIGGKRPLRFARHLPARGWRPVVFCAPVGTPGERDDSLLAFLPADLRVVREYAPRWLWTVRSLGDTVDRRFRPPTESQSEGGVGRSAGGRLAGSIQRLAELLIPMDAVVAFLPHAVAAASRLIAAERPDALYVSAYPYSSLVLAAALKRRHGLPLICELRDPWTMNFQFTARHPAVAALERRLERWVFATADRVVVTTDALRDAYERLYPDLPAGRFVRIYSSYDEGLAPGDAASPPDGPFTVIHFGNIYGPRPLAPLLHALARLKAERGLGPGSVRYLILGRLDHPEDHLAIHALGLDGDVVIRPKLPYAEGMAALRRADVLHLLSYSDEKPHIPGKLYDYLLAGRPILCDAACPEMAAIVARTGTGRSVRPGDADAMLEFLRQALDARHGGPPLARPIRAEIERFSAPAVTAELAALLDELVR
jgi:hypothetical protein